MNNYENNLSDTIIIKSCISRHLTGFFECRKNRISGVILALLIGFLFTFLLVENTVGINYFLFCTALTSAIGFVLCKDDNLDIKRFSFWALSLIIYFSVFLRLTGTTYTIFTILISPILLVLMSVFSSKRLPKNIFVNSLIRFFGSIAFINMIFLVVESLIKKDKSSKKTTGKIIIGVVISIFLLLIILPLMFSADAMFEKFVIDMIDLSFLGEILWKTVLSIVISILFFGFLYIITVKKDVPQNSIKSLTDRTYNFEAALITILGILGLVYSLFAAVQFRYLFVGINGTFPVGFSYTEYARNGYFEQVFLSIINFMIIIAAIVFTNKSSGRLRIVISIMLSYFILINLYVISSAVYKMYLYQSTYGFTVLRILVYILLLFETVTFLSLTVKIFSRKMNYFKFILYFTIIFWAIISLINIEGLSADLNIKRFEQTGKIDISYLVELDDVSDQLRFLYIEHYDKIETKDIEKIELYFYGDQRYASRSDMINQNWKEDSILEFNISRYKRYKNALIVSENNS